MTTGHTQSHSAYVGIGEAARQLGISTDTLRRWANRGAVQSVRTPGGQRRFPLTEIERVRSESGPWPAIQPDPTSED